MGKAEIKYKNAHADGLKSTILNAVKSIEYDIYRNAVLIEFTDGEVLILAYDNVGYIRADPYVEIKRVISEEGDIIYGK